MTITLDIKSKKVLATIDKLDRAIPRELKQGLHFIGKRLRNTASKNILKKPRSGIIYKYKGRRHRSSKEKESWANRSGTARRGIVHHVTNPLQLSFGNTTEYAKWLEFGSPKMKPRPAHKIAITQNNKNIITILSNSIKKGFEV